MSWKFDVDSQMLRGSNGDTKYNLAVGEPAIVDFSFTKFEGPSVWSKAFRYPPFQGHGELLSLLKKIFKAKHAVITTGCKQALFAAVHALQMEAVESDDESKQTLYHWQKTYWPSYLTIADYMTLGFEAGNHGALAAINVTTWPNNPDGMMDRPQQFEFDIWDAAYTSPIYGFNGIRPRHRISTWSAAKLFGVPGLRIGWALTDDENLAQHMAQYVEKTTSGVAYTSQISLLNILEKLQGLSLLQTTSEMQRIYQKICLNGEYFRKYLGGHVEEVRGVPALHGGGMFAFFKVPDARQARFEKALKKVGVKLVDGRACGAPESEFWFRMSMGQTNEFTEEALAALAKELEK